MLGLGSRWWKVVTEVRYNGSTGALPRPRGPTLPTWPIPFILWCSRLDQCLFFASPNTDDLLRPLEGRGRIRCVPRVGNTLRTRTWRLRNPQSLVSAQQIANPPGWFTPPL
jgi:hypothetical protein